MNTEPWEPLTHDEKHYVWDWGGRIIAMLREGRMEWGGVEATYWTLMIREKQKARFIELFDFFGSPHATVVEVDPTSVGWRERSVDGTYWKKEEVFGRATELLIDLGYVPKQELPIEQVGYPIGENTTELQKEGLRKWLGL